MSAYSCNVCGQGFEGRGCNCDSLPDKEDTCPGCKEPVSACYYGGDCLEVRQIYREQQREKLADVVVEELHDCPFCGCPSDNRNGCYDCIG